MGHGVQIYRTGGISSPFGVVGIGVQKNFYGPQFKGALREKLGTQNFEIWIDRFRWAPSTTIR